MNALYLRRRSKVTLPEGTGATPLNVLAALQKNLETLGFLLAADVTDALGLLSPIQVDAFYQRLIKDLRSMVGAHRQFKPMYPNFPAQVMEMTEAELYFRAITHYRTLKRPEFEAEERAGLADKPKYRIIRLGSRADFESIFTLLAKSKSPFSPQDQEDVKWFVAQYRDGIKRLLPEQIPCKENLGLLGAALLRHTSDADAVLGGHVKTATDVLRIAVAVSGGDVSLAAACKFGKFRRSERALLLGWIERAANRTEDMLRWKGRWVRLGERLHPAEYTNRFPEAAAAFDVIRNDRPFETFNSRIEQGLVRKDTDTVLDALDARPGELARRLDHVARTAPDAAAVVSRFRARADKVSTPVLLQVMTHFRHRNESGDLRVFFPKGSVAKVFATRNDLPPLPAGAALELVTVCERALLDRFAKLPPLGTTYVDERLKSYLVPFSQRSASKSLRTLVRGSRLPLPECTTLRFFVWWKNGKSRVDIDLSAVLYDADFGTVSQLTYYNLKDFGGHHSGDITDAPKGAAEFIDVSLAKCLERKVRYVVMCINSYTQQPYCDLPECFAGWMGRQAPSSGEIFEPKTVVDKVDVASDTQMCLPAVFDLVSREVIWADIALTGNPRWVNNVAGNLRGVSLMLRALTGLRKTDLYTLFALHARARGEAVQSPEHARTVFAVDQGVTPFDLDRIAAEFM
ncbi:TerD family protein [Gemmata sp. JC717]|uniref:TerD family protein n=1 Tax=Gemmata algarum TaxID=2975278 RepID=UPI0021BB87F0|nr:TerD family protein [Gemmata algarum]MDY3552901.1 TerD family protein [Gemmata algarum]